MREITTHKVNGLNEAITITVLDEPGQGGACHLYNLAAWKQHPPAVAYQTFLSFQRGLLHETEVNGLSNEALLAVVLDRLTSFQDGPYPCEHNQYALEHVEQALLWLKRRAEERLARGVQDTHTP